MSTPLFTILYVRDVPASAAFYQEILGTPALESAPTFAMFPLSDGHMLGLWVESGVKPAPADTGDRAEIALTVPDQLALEATQDRWLAAGARSLQEIRDMDFGRNFLVTDPDGHRLRAFVPR